jgi:hypothetical protein
VCLNLSTYAIPWRSKEYVPFTCLKTLFISPSVCHSIGFLHVWLLVFQFYFVLQTVNNNGTQFPFFTSLLEY